MWTKSKLWAALEIESRLRMDVMDKFEDYWLKHIWKKEYDSDAITAFFAPIVDEDNDFTFEFDRKTREWVIHYGDEDYRFDENWIYDDLDKEPQVEMLWHSGYYDGPLSGMALLDGEKMVWFHCDKWGGYDDEDLTNDFGHRTFGLYELTEEEMAAEIIQHEHFRQHVGHHTDYGDARGEFRASKADMDKYYEMYKPGERPEYHKSREPLMVVADVQFRWKPRLTSQGEDGTIVRK